MSLLRLCLALLCVLVLAACAHTGAQTQDPAPVADANPTNPEVRREGNLVLDQVPPVPEALQESLRRYQNMRPANFIDWLPNDAGVLISVRFGDVAQLARVTMPEGMRTQLTFYNEPIAQAWVSPDPTVNGVIFSKDQGGDEYFQLYFMNLGDQSVRRLTDGKSRNEQVVFARDGRRFAYSSTRRTGKDFDIWVGDVSSAEPHRLLVQQGGTWYPLDFSPDGRKLAVVQWFSIADARIYLADLVDGSLQRIEISAKPSFDNAALFEPDGKNLLILTDATGEWQQLVRYNLERQVAAPLFRQKSWDVEGMTLSPDGRYLALIRNADGSSQIEIYDRSQQLAEAGKLGFDFGVVPKVAFNAAGTELGFGISGPQIPGDVFSRRLHTDVLTRWTRGETGGIDPATFVSPKLERYGAHDADPMFLGLPRQIPTYIYRPAGEGPFPVLVMIHGGPEAQSRPMFSDFIQFLVREMRIAVVVPNVRGSAGYGKTYLSLDNGKLREDSVKDIGALLSWIQAQPDLDAQRVAVYGGSYGGYMVLASMVQFGDQLSAGVDIVGISNFVTFLENTNPYRVDQRRPEYGDERDPAMRAFLEQISPLTRAHEIVDPLFVIQGANDPRVPASEAEQIVKAVRDNKQTAWYMLALDEGHGFKKKENRDQMTEAVALFLEQHLVKAPVAATEGE